MPNLTSEQRAIVGEINRAANALPRKLRRTFRIAAVETGLVESGLRNLTYGTGDSQGWRQERKSLYADPTNVRASVARFRDEFVQHYQPGETAGQVAAQVQRPAAQYAGRYQAAKPQALQVLGQYGGGAPGGSYGVQAPSVGSGPSGQDLKLQYLQNTHNPDALLQLATGLQQAQGGSRTLYRAIDDPASNNAVALMKAAAERIDQAKVPYQWGGGHQGRQGPSSPVTALDCSGAVSRVLGIDPLVSGQLASWGKAGRGRRVTVYANGTHTLLELDGRVFATSAENPGGGAGWVPKSYFPKGYFKNFAARHPPNL